MSTGPDAGTIEDKAMNIVEQINKETMEAASIKVPQFGAGDTVVV